MNWGYKWAPYVSAAQKKSQALRAAAELAKKQKRNPDPVVLKGRQIASTFWGKAWCDNLSSYQDYSNRLSRGATYIRNGSVVDLVIKPKKIEALVAGSEPYTVSIEIKGLDPKQWKAIRTECSESIDSLLDLLSGKLSDGVMKRLTDQKSGLFPAPKEIRMSCSCPDFSSCCKHLAAVMYGVGSRLDNRPELLFLLRGVDHTDLVSHAIAAGNLERELSSTSGGLDSQDLGAIFGIELDGKAPMPSGAKPTKPSTKKAKAVEKPEKAVAKKSRSVAKKATSTPVAVKPTAKSVAAKPAKDKVAAEKKSIATKSPSAKGRASSTSKSARKGKAAVKAAARRSSRS